MTNSIKKLQVDFLEDLEIAQGPEVENQPVDAFVRLFNMSLMGRAADFHYRAGLDFI